LADSAPAFRWLGFRLEPKNPEGDRLSHHPSGKHDADTLLVKPKFGGVVMVCGDCERRGNGPSKLRAREVRKQFKHGMGNLPVRLRVVQCSCLGLCPKKALAVAAMAHGEPVRAAEVCSENDADAVALRWARDLR
jgi:hypothetical protein